MSEMVELDDYNVKPHAPSAKGMRVLGIFPEFPYKEKLANAYGQNIAKEEDHLREGCLSFPELWLMVKRPVQVTLKFFNSDGEEIVETYEGTTARVILHEYDHMLGANFTHRVSKLKLERGLKAVAKKHKKHQRRIQRFLKT